MGSEDLYGLNNVAEARTKIRYIKRESWLYRWHLRHRHGKRWL